MDLSNDETQKFAAYCEEMADKTLAEIQQLTKEAASQFADNTPAAVRCLAIKKHQQELSESLVRVAQHLKRLQK